jgi:hypothetical protein
MVNLVVKGTKFIDEFTYQCSVTATVGELCAGLTRIQNARHRVGLQSLSVAEMVPAAKKANAALGDEYEQRHDAIAASLKDKATPVSDAQFDDCWQEFKARTVALFPSECVHADGDVAAVENLYAMHQNPDIDEDYRLHVYHCRAVLDPEYRPTEVLDVAKAGMWFCGKAMAPDATVGKYCSNNEKSKITVKLALADGAAPSKEPRMSYNDQRELRGTFDRKAEEFKTLEAPELGDRVALLRRAEQKEAVRNTAPSGGDGAKINVGAMRPIYSGASVSTTDA